jgi:hypothetical protein
VGEVLAMGDQALVQVAGEQGDAVGARVVPEEVAGWSLAGKGDSLCPRGLPSQRFMPTSSLVIRSRQHIERRVNGSRRAKVHWH